MDVEKLKNFILENQGLSTFIAGSGISLLVSLAFSYLKSHIPSGTVLELDLTTTKVTFKPKEKTFLDIIIPNNVVYFYNIIDCIKKASQDSKVSGIIIRINESFESFPLSYIEELRSTLESFKSTKNFVTIYSDIFTLRSYYFASVATKIYTHPTTLFIINGLIGYGQFFKKTLEKLNIEMDGFQREKYKNAYNSFFEEKFTDEHKESVTSLINSVNSIFISEIAKGRNVKEEQVKLWIEEGMYISKIAKEQGLIDDLVFYDNIQEKIKIDFSMSYTNFIFTSVYTEKVGKLYPVNKSILPFSTIHEIAVLLLFGTIGEGESRDGLMGADTVARRIRKIGEGNCKAVIIRVDSPGGSAIASDTIGNAIEGLKKKGIKVIISMGSVAASGGYWISMNADSIVCNRTTITGSIGVLSLKPNLRKFYSEWLGVTFDDYQTSETSTMFSFLHSLKKGSHNEKKFNELIDHFYQDFLEGVSKGRKIEKGKVRDLAQGKVYTGEEAIKVKLVDKLGGFSEAIDEAKSLLKLSSSDAYTLKYYPEPVKVLSLLFPKKPKNSRERTEEISFLPTPFYTFMKIYQMLKSPLQNILYMTESKNQVQAICEVKQI